MYRKISKDPTSATERKMTKELKDLKQKKHILKNRLKPRAIRPPQLYSVTTTTHCIMYWVSPLPASQTHHIPMTGRTSSFLKNSRHFAEIMRKVKLSEMSQW